MHEGNGPKRAFFSFIKVTTGLVVMSNAKRSFQGCKHRQCAATSPQTRARRRHLSVTPRLFVLEQQRFASVTRLITDINNRFLSWEKGNQETSDNYNDDDNEDERNKVKRGFFFCRT